MSGELDMTKWLAPATNGDVCQAILECRLAMQDIRAALLFWTNGQLDEANRCMVSFSEHDQRLHDLINDIGGLA